MALCGKGKITDSLLDVLHLNSESEANCLSFLHISLLPRRKPHSEPHMMSMQRRAKTCRRQCVQPHDFSLCRLALVPITRARTRKLREFVERCTGCGGVSAGRGIEAMSYPC